MFEHSVVLKRGKERIFSQRHHWIFSGAIASYPDGYSDGDLIAIRSHEGRMLGWGFFKRGLSLAERIVTFGEMEVYQSLKMSLSKAVDLRRALLNNPQTTACRLVNGEGDCLPGLIIDKYGPYLVVQTGALGMRQLLPFLVDQLRELLPICGIYDKSVGGSLKQEGIDSQEEILWGEIPESVEIKEEGMRFHVSLIHGQKTGFFL